MANEEVVAFEYEDVVEESKNDEEQEEQEEEENLGEEEEQGEEKDLSPAEELARSEGWVPQDDWKGNKDDWVDYKEFNLRGELMKRIKSQSTQIHTQMEKTENLEQALKVLGEHNKKIAETEYKRALRDLKAQKREALEENDYDAADELDEQIDEIKEAKSNLDKEEKEEEVKEDPKNTKPKLSPEQHKIVKDWYEDPKNKWYEEDTMLQPIANQLFLSRLESNGGDFEDAFTYMGTKMKSRFPEEVGGVTKKGSAVSESNGRANGKSKNKSKSKFSSKDLSDEQAKVGKTFVDTGVFDNMQEYVDQLVATGELS